MAKTTVLTGNALTQKLWQEELYRDVVKEAFFSRFMGKTASSLVHVRTDLEQNQGDTINFGIRMRLTGAGVTSGVQLVGNEESLSTYSFDVTLEEYAHAVRDRGPLDRKRAIYKMDDESRAALKDWGAEKIDQLAFDALQVGSGATGNPSVIMYKTSAGPQATATAATAKGALTSADSKLTPGFVSAIKAWAKTAGARGSGRVPLRPIRVDGEEIFAMLVHPDCLYDFKVDSTYQGFMRDAAARGEKNPLFTGAVAMIDGVVIFEHENCAIAADGGGASVPWAKCAFMGAQSLCWAWGQQPDVVAEEFDYGREHGYKWGMIAGVEKPVFNSNDYGSIGVYLARTNIAGLI